MKELYDLYLDMPCLYFHFIWFDRDDSKDLHCRKDPFKLDLTQNTYLDRCTFKIDSNTESGSYGVMVSVLASSVLDRGLELRARLECIRSWVRAPCSPRVYYIVG